MRATLFLVAAFVASTAAAGLSSFAPGSSRALPTPRMSVRSVLNRLPEAHTEKKPPLAPFPTYAWWSGVFSVSTRFIDTCACPSTSKPRPFT